MPTKAKSGELLTAESKSPESGDLPARWTAASRMNINLDVPDDVLWGAATAEMNTALISALRCGYYLEELKARCQHGDFSKEMERRNITSQRGSEFMRLARHNQALPEDVVAKMLSAGKSKAMELARYEPELIEQMEADGTLDDVLARPISEMRAALKQTEERANRLDALLEKEQLKTKDLQRSLANRRASQDFPEFVAVARQEAAALNAELAAATDALEQLAQAHVFDVAAAPSDNDQRDAHVALAAGAVYHAVCGETGRLARLAEHIAETFGEAMGVDPGRFLLTDAEAEQAKADADFINLRHGQAKQQRHIERENHRPGKRGRKMKAAS